MCDCNREIGQTQYQPDEGVDKDVALKVVDETIVVKRLKELDNDIKAEKLDLDFYFAEDPKDAFEDDGCLKIIAPRIESVEGLAWKYSLPKDAVERYLKESGIPPALARANSALVDITMIARRFAKKYWKKNAECSKLEAENCSLRNGEMNLRADFRNLSDDADSLKKELDAKTEKCAKLESVVNRLDDYCDVLIKEKVDLKLSKANLEVELDDVKFDNTCKFITGCAAGVIASAIVATIAICLL